MISSVAAPATRSASYFAHSDVFVAPANLESFGIAALEARCAGLPVVAKAHTGISEFVNHDKEGLLATSDADMVHQLNRIVRDAELRRIIAAHNRSTPVARRLVGRRRAQRRRLPHGYRVDGLTRRLGHRRRPAG